MNLRGKKAIITGAGSGFGAGIAKAFSNQGAKLILADINFPNVKDVAKEIGAIPIEADVSNQVSVEKMIDFSIKKFTAIDIIVNNAGITHLPAPMEKIEEDEFDRIFKVNAKSVYLSSKAIIPHFKDRNSGVILNIASTAGISPRPNLTWYNASKGWMITATKSMAIELAKYKIRVNAINPVAGETPLLKSFMGEDNEQNRLKFLSTIPIGRFSTPTDIGNAAVFLCSERASMITGVALEIDGGRCI